MLPVKLNTTLAEFIPPSSQLSLVPLKALLDKLPVAIEVDTPPEIIVGPVLNGLGMRGTILVSFAK